MPQRHHQTRGCAFRYVWAVFLDEPRHKTAGYLVNEENGNMIVGDFDPVAPPVIGE